MKINKEELKTLKESDPIIKEAFKDSDEELSPMNPPDAYSPLSISPVPFEEMHPFLQKLVDEHKAFSDVLNKFEASILNWRENKWTFNKEIDEGLKQFFNFFDEKVPLHNQKEEKILFPLLHDKLIESGEHNSADSSITGINLMEDEHIKIAQAAAIVFNFLGLGSRLPDQQSRNITYQAAFDQGIAIIETMKLHIFREENILFPQTMQLFTPADLNKLK